MIIFTIILITISAICIFQLRGLTSRLKFTTHKNPQIDALFKFQIAQLALAVLVLIIVYYIDPANFTAFFRFGDILAPIGRIAWLCIAGNESWLGIAASMGSVITIVTGVFMAGQLRKTSAVVRTLPSLLPWVILFSALNAFSEEAIFRIGIVVPLYGRMAVPTILLLSGLLFGLPHYFGQPSGIIGVLMSGFLGWLLAMSLVETQGLFLAWAIHFVQDVVILGSMFMMSAGSRYPTPNG